MEELIRLFRRELFSAFFEWLEVNKEYLGKWYSDLYNKGKEAEADATNAINIMAASLWMFNMIANCGVLCGIGLDGPTWMRFSPRPVVVSPTNLLFG